MSRSLLEDKEARRTCQAGEQNIEARGGEATWLLLEIPHILVQLEGRGPAKVGCVDEELAETLGSATPCTWWLLLGILTDMWRCQQAGCEPAVACRVWRSQPSWGSFPRS